MFGVFLIAGVHHNRDHIAERQDDKEEWKDDKFELESLKEETTDHKLTYKVVKQDPSHESDYCIACHIGIILKSKWGLNKKYGYIRSEKGKDNDPEDTLAYESD